MVPVPDALRIVLEETNRIFQSNNNGDSGCGSGKSRPNELVSLLSSSSYSLGNNLVGRVLASDVVMTEPGYPPYNASVMDGYAIRTQDKFPIVHDIGTEDDIVSPTHRVVDKVYAGDDKSLTSSSSPSSTPSSPSPSQLLPPAYYITTGAVVPEGYNCVVPIEEVRECSLAAAGSSSSSSTTTTTTEKLIQIIAPPSAIVDQKWIRPIGCDIPATSTVLPAGHILDPVDIGLLRQSGVNQIELKRRIRVGVLSTGNELITVDDDTRHDEGDNAASTGTRPEPVVGKIPDVNRPILLSLLASYGRGRVEPIDLGMVRDDSVEDMTSRIQDAMMKHNCDVIITTGGVSMGETDIVEHVLVDKCGGTLHFGRMMMKPGKPTTFVTVPSKTGGDGDGSTKIVFALPGNPVSATVCTQLLVKPCLDLYFDGLDRKNHTTIDDAWIHPEIMVKLSHDIKLDAKRPEYHRVTLHQNSEDGTFWATSTGVQQSSRLLSLRDATGLLVLPSASGTKTVAMKGDEYLVLVLNYTAPSYFSADTIRPVRLKDSIHLKKPRKAMKVGVVKVLPQNDQLLSSFIEQDLSNLDETCRTVQDALSGSKSGNAAVVWKKSYAGHPQDLYDLIASDTSTETLDFIVVVCVMYDGSFLYNVEVASTLKQRLTKPANAMALQARKGAAAQDSTAALFEVAIGYMSENHGSMIVCVPDRGLQGALSNIRGLLKHGLNLARGKPHNHHH